MDGKLKLIIFDLDNTLFPFNYLWLKANKETFKEYNLLNNIDYDNFTSLYLKYDLHFWEQHDAGLINLDELRELRLIKTLDHFSIYISHEEANKYFNTIFNKLLSSIMINKKMNNLLIALKEKVDIAILTNGKSEEQNIKIDNLGIRTIFGNNIFISQEIGYEKPDSNAFLSVTSKYNCSPKECLFIGDSFKNDIIGALNTDMKAIFLANGNENKVTYKNNDFYIFDDKIEVLLEKLLDDNYRHLLF
ncbi:HAD family hydrolase [Staphylococcus sp. GSSP0090]|nr:HAD family hydrolase [Staphylococcus sp. GSSP0090]